jgi:hypothetical protein
VQIKCRTAPHSSFAAMRGRRENGSSSKSIQRFTTTQPLQPASGPSPFPSPSPQP